MHKDETLAQVPESVGLEMEGGVANSPVEVVAVDDVPS